MKPISNTAFYCCGARTQDAKTKNPICGDTYAERFMDEDGKRIFEPFKTNKYSNLVLVARARIIDDAIRNLLISDPNLWIITIGTGFDTRPYRLQYGNWVELDEPASMQFKEEKLPKRECQNTLHRVTIDFETDSLKEKLSHLPISGEVVIVYEGVFMYLEESQIKANLRVLQELFPKHQLFCDLITRKFFERRSSQAIQKKLRGMGAPFTFTYNDPGKLFLKQNYSLSNKKSILGEARDQKWVKIPNLIANLFMKTIINGYSIYRFKFESDLS